MIVAAGAAVGVLVVVVVVIAVRGRNVCQRRTQEDRLPGDCEIRTTPAAVGPLGNDAGPSDGAASGDVEGRRA